MSRLIVINLGMILQCKVYQRGYDKFRSALDQFPSEREKVWKKETSAFQFHIIVIVKLKLWCLLVFRVLINSAIKYVEVSLW